VSGGSTRCHRPASAGCSRCHHRALELRRPDSHLRMRPSL
jgi:hypothetical protein